MPASPRLRHPDGVQVTFHGVRGSTPAPGADFAGVGGHTSCVAVAAAGRADPALVLDAGTGLRSLSAALDGRPFRGTVLLGHMHWDHTQGLPFFSAGDREDASVTVLGPAQADGSGLEENLTRMLAPPLFPIVPGQLRGRWTFGDLEAGAHRIEGFDVLALEIPHKGGRTFGYRVSDGSAALAYLSDHAPQALGAGPDGLGERHEAALALAGGVDLLVHDAQYTAAELPERGAFGHAAAEYAVALAAEAGARRVALFHHDPARTDGEVAALAGSVKRRGESPDVLVAREGLSLRLG
jgi:phosphoribosyl 1,2-cyclic phosphodiesterase